eukprot:CAMPEP_0167772166 /NCGR_PEP_ID=MMETSP0111_2-20121227/694_1 /TAXON_ID=91324 /ORGANISM="Lotharella globosa, Strain CCCM811" /LENGTH=283 /DNA_ID=CAMNT_0007661623 /DNA_START=44 /DNA_END=895 /DNA_ORIENTATION=+
MGPHHQAGMSLVLCLHVASVASTPSHATTPLASTASLRNPQVPGHDGGVPRRALAEPRFRFHHHATSAGGLGRRMLRNFQKNSIIASSNANDRRNRFAVSAGVASTWDLGFFLDGAKKRTTAKEELLSVIKPLDRGDGATEEQQAQVELAARKVERLNPNPRTLDDSILSGKWELIYTTSAQILCSNRPALLKPRKLYQTLDIAALKGKNEQVSYLGIPESVTAEFTPKNKTTVAVQFKQFGIGPFKFKAPEFFKGELRTTYVDEDMRISRGDKDNLFVLLRV